MQMLFVGLNTSLMAVRNSDDSQALWDEAARISRIEQQDSHRSLHPHYSSATNHEMRRIQVTFRFISKTDIRMKSLFQKFVAWRIVAEFYLQSFWCGCMHACKHAGAGFCAQQAQEQTTYPLGNTHTYI